MTGLEADRHVIVEIATLITDDDLVVVAEGPDLVVHASDEELVAMDDFVRDMHTGSGLLDGDLGHVARRRLVRFLLVGHRPSVQVRLT